MYSVDTIGVTRLYHQHSDKLLSPYRFWRYFLHAYLVEFRRLRLLGKYSYDYVPNRIRYSGYTQYINRFSVHYNDFWLRKILYDKSYVNIVKSFQQEFYLFERSHSALFWEDYIYMFMMYSIHKYIKYYILGLFTQAFNMQSINYYPQIHTNEDYLDPAILDPDFICKYIKVAISKGDTIYEAISEVRVWIVRSIHKFKTYSYFYRKGYRNKLVSYKLAYEAPLVRSVKIEVSGRVHDRQRTVVRMYKLGWKTTTARVKDRPLQYSSCQGQSKYGIFGIKVWVLFHHQPTRGLVK
jgi:hypothetical protein